ncbi:MAG: ABC transporter permease [Actinomycetota bacterium]|jgi:ABC-type transport system involved in multi-copper enzyme maturation permease subunit|nr:ABC transporter permease [Actinomycetota bacterium]
MTRLVRSELFKLRTTPGPWILLVIDMVACGLFLLIPFHQAGSLTGGGYAAPSTVQDLRDMLGVGYEAALFLAPIIGVLSVTGEYRHKVLTTTLLFSPRRADVLTAKAIASILWGLLLGLGSFVVVGAEGLSWFAADGGSFSSLAHQIVPVVPGVLGAFALLALFGVGIGVLVKNQVAGVLVTIGGTIIVEQLLVALFQNVFHMDLNWLPSEASAALVGGVFNGRATGAGRLLSWWAGGLALLAWGVVPGVLGYFTTFRRDVT